MRTVKDNGVELRKSQEFDFSKVFAASGDVVGNGRSCFYEFAAKKQASFTKYVERDESDFINSLMFFTEED